MKAAVITDFGGPEVVDVRDVPDPEPKPGEVVVAVKRAALNHLDIWVRLGKPAPDLPMPHIIGTDAAGVVTELGAGVDGTQTGREVIVDAALSCGTCEFCRRGQDSECTDFGLLGVKRSGVFAEKVAVPAEDLIPKPAALSFEEAACLPVAYLTAWRMLMTRAELKAGETVLIHGIGGGVATAALVFSKLMGAETIVTSSSDDKLARAEKIGANHSLNYRKTDDLPGAILDITGGRGIDVAIDSVGAATWPVNLQVTRKDGRIVLCGVTTGAQAETSLQAVYWNQLNIIGSTMGSREDFRLMLKAMMANDVHPVIDSTYPLDKAREAMEKMENEKQFGKIVLEVAG